METHETGVAAPQTADNLLTGTVGNFGVRVVCEGDAYGLNDCLRWDKKEPAIELYILADSHGKPYPGRGWFVSRYYYTTLKFRKGSNEGLCLDGGDYENCTLAANQFREAMRIADAKVATFASEGDIESWRKSWLIFGEEL